MCQYQWLPSQHHQFPPRHQGRLLLYSFPEKRFWRIVFKYECVMNLNCSYLFLVFLCWYYWYLITQFHWGFQYWATGFRSGLQFYILLTGPYLLHSTLLVHLLLVLVTLLGDPAVGRVHVVLKQLVLAEGGCADCTLVREVSWLQSLAVVLGNMVQQLPLIHLNKVQLSDWKYTCLSRVLYETKLPNSIKIWPKNVAKNNKKIWMKNIVPKKQNIWSKI